MSLSPLSSAYSFSPVDIFGKNYEDEDDKSNSTIDEPSRNGERSRCPSDDTDDSCAANNYVLPTFERRNDYDYDFRDLEQVLLRMRIRCFAI